MNRLLPVLLAAVLLLLAAAPVSGATIQGEVRKADSGEPLPAATVVAYTSGGVLHTRAETGSAGNWAMSLPAGDYRLVAWDPAGVYAPSFYRDADSFDTSLVLSLAGNDTVGSIRFLLPKGGQITGAVTDAASGVALAGRTVAAWNDRSGTLRSTTASAADGSWKLVLPPGDYRLVAWDDTLEHAPEFYRNAARFEDAARLLVTAGETIAAVDFALAASALAGGTVRDATGSRLPDMRVSIYDSRGELVREVVTAADGTWSQRLAPGNHRLLAWDPAGLFASAFWQSADSFETSDPVGLSTGDVKTDFHFMLPQGLAIAGITRNGATGAAVPSIVVAVYNASGSLREKVQSDASGIWKAVVPAGEYAVAAWDDNLIFAPQFYVHRRTYAEADRVILTSPAAGVDFDMRRAALVVGRVTNRSGEPLAGIAVIAYDLDGRPVSRAQTGANGDFRVAVSSGSAKLSFADDEHRYATLFFASSAGFENASVVMLGEGEFLDTGTSIMERQQRRRRPALRPGGSGALGLPGVER